MAITRSYPLYRTTALTRWLIWLLYAQAALGVIAVFSGQLERRLLQGMSAGAFSDLAAMAAAADVSDTRQMLIGLAQVALFIASVVLALVWTYRSNANLWTAQVKGLDYSPGWAAGWYFVPIMNLFRPFQVMRELHNASASPRRWNIDGAPVSIQLWWGMWIISNLVGRMAFSTTMKAESIDEMIRANLFTQASDAIGIVAALAFAWVIQSIAAFQADASHMAPPEAVEAVEAAFGAPE